MIYFLAVVLAYLIGSFPSGVVVVRIVRGIDVRWVGSRRSGATNVFRAAGVVSATIVFILDLLKGAGAVWLGMGLAGSPEVAERWFGLLGRPPAWPLPDVALSPTWAGMACGLAAIAGHNWPIYIRFRGGRGVTTSLGTIIPLAPAVAAVGFGVGMTIILLTRYASLGSMVGSACVPTGMLVQSFLVFTPVPVIFYGALICAMIVFQHRDNIARLRAGTERRLGEKVESPPGS